jgi:hypothetical protein
MQLGCPDWVCDIVEPSNEAFIYKTRKPFYRHIGVSWFWILDARKDKLEIHSASQSDWQLFGTFRGTGMVRSSVRASSRSGPASTAAAVHHVLHAEVRSVLAPTEKPQPPDRKFWRGFCRP